MQTITEIIGGAQQFFSFTYNIEHCFPKKMTDDHKTFLLALHKVESNSIVPVRATKVRGRPAYTNICFYRAFLAKSFFKLPTTKALIERLQVDCNLQIICGFQFIPSEATFSRVFAVLATADINEATHISMIKTNVSQKLVGHISKDSSAIEARETPINKKRDVKLPSKGKRGRPKKGSEAKEKELTRMERQINETAVNSLSELDKAASWGCKKNSQGNVSYWKGYKVHFDVTDMGIPVTAVVTGANVHDSQVAIPLEKLTEQRVTHLYTLMDAAYDAQPIRNYIESKGRRAIIDPNNRKKAEARSFNPAEKMRFKIRSTVERTNSHIKEWFLSGKLMVKGYVKVNFHIMCAVLMLTAVKILHNFS